MTPRPTMPTHCTAFLSAVVLLLGACASVDAPKPGEGASPGPADPLSAWSDTAVKRTLLEYLTEVTQRGSTGFIPPEHRLAAFDFDGTLGCEKPDYMEVMVAVNRLCELTETDSFLPPTPDGSGKAEIIRNRIGQQPVFAFGNSMGDFEMLQYATSSRYPSLGLILVHDDPEEYVYRDSELIQHAEQNGWQAVSMKDDFEVIFPE